MPCPVSSRPSLPSGSPGGWAGTGGPQPRAPQNSSVSTSPPAPTSHPSGLSCPHFITSSALPRQQPCDTENTTQSPLPHFLACASGPLLHTLPTGEAPALGLHCPAGQARASLQVSDGSGPCPSPAVNLLPSVSFCCHSGLRVTSVSGHLSWLSFPPHCPPALPLPFRLLLHICPPTPAFLLGSRPAPERRKDGPWSGNRDSPRPTAVRNECACGHQRPPCPHPRCPGASDTGGQPQSCTILCHSGRNWQSWRILRLAGGEWWS